MDKEILHVYHLNKDTDPITSLPTGAILTLYEGAIGEIFHEGQTHTFNGKHYRCYLVLKEIDNPKDNPDTSAIEVSGVKYTCYHELV